MYKSLALASGLSVALATSTAVAAPLATDPDAITGRTGTYVLPLGTGQSATIDYAIYLSGPGRVFTTPGLYIYAYQFTAVTSPLSLIAFFYAIGGFYPNVGLAPELGLPGGVSTIVATDSVVPAGIYRGNWQILFPSPLAVGEHSQVFWMASPTPPGGAAFYQFQLGSGVLGGGAELLPSPAPAPGAASIAAIACAFCLRRRR